MGSNHDDLARLASFFGGQEALSVVQALSDAGTTTDDIIAVNANVKLKEDRLVHLSLETSARPARCVRPKQEEESSGKDADPPRI